MLTENMEKLLADLLTENMEKLLADLVRQRNDAFSVLDNSSSPLIQDFAFIDVLACNQKIAKLQEIAQGHEKRPPMLIHRTAQPLLTGTPRIDAKS